jgi:hypothetical protein
MPCNEQHSIQTNLPKKGTCDATNQNMQRGFTFYLVAKGEKDQKTKVKQLLS